MECFVHGLDEPRDVIPGDTFQKAVESLRSALDSGINHFETAFGYQKSEHAYGQALHLLELPGDQYFLMTKGNPKTASDLRALVGEQLKADRRHR